MDTWEQKRPVSQSTVQEWIHTECKLGERKEKKIRHFFVKSAFVPLEAVLSQANDVWKCVISVNAKG